MTPMGQRAKNVTTKSKNSQLSEMTNDELRESSARLYKLIAPLHRAITDNSREILPFNQELARRASVGIGPKAHRLTGMQLVGQLNSRMSPHEIDAKAATVAETLETSPELEPTLIIELPDTGEILFFAPSSSLTKETPSKC